MKLLVAFCLLALLAIVSCSPALERVRRQTSVDVDVRSQGGRPVGTVGVSRQIPGGSIRGSATFGDGKPIWRGEVNREWGNNNFNFNLENQGRRTNAGAEFTHRSDRWGDFGLRGSVGSDGDRSVGVLWRRRFRRAAAEHYAQLMDLLDEE